MENLQSKVQFERVKIGVPMQQFMARLDAKRRDDAVDRLAHRDATASQQTIVLRGGDGKLGSEWVEYREVHQVPPRLSKSHLTANAL